MSTGPAPDPDRSPERSRGRLVIAYGSAAALLVALVAAAILLFGGGGQDDGDDELAAINPQSGITDGKEPDGRQGTSIEASGSADSLYRDAQQAGCTLTEDLADEGNTHLPPDAPEPDYKTNPAASGDHYPEPQADGAYLDPVGPLRYNHAIEHGRIAVGYSPGLGEDAQLELKGLFDTDPAAMLLFPIEAMPYEVAAVAWTRLLTCERYEGEVTLAAIAGFREKWRGRGPERLAY